MGWLCIDDACTIRIFTISDEISNLVEQLFLFLINLHAGIYVGMIIMIIIVFLIYVFHSIRKTMLSDH